jgi:YVTN family beta-propeller protein
MFHMCNHFSSRMLAGATVLLSLLSWTGCGDTFRPVVNPITPPGGTPQTLSSVTVISQGVTVPPGTSTNPAACTSAPCPGTTSVIDVSGDTDNADVVIGRNPVQGVLSPSGVLLAANQADDSLSSFVPFSGAATSNTISLTSNPVFLGGTESAVVYVALPGVDQVAVISTSTLALNGSPVQLASGSKPVALAELPNQSKVYVADSGNATVSVIQSSTATVSSSATIEATISLPGTTPVWVTAKPDGSAIYVLDQAGNVEIINTVNDTSVGSVAVGKRPACSASGTPCGFMYFDSHLQRLYVPNPSDNTISAFDASQTDSSGNPKLVPLPVGCTSCAISLGSPGAGTPVSLTVSGDGGRIYIADSPLNNVTVLDASSFTIKTTIPVGINPVSIAASSDGSKIYVANNGQLNPDGTVAQVNSIPQTGSISIISTASDVVTVTIKPPFQDSTCVADSTSCPRNAPVWVIGY